MMSTVKTMELVFLTEQNKSTVISLDNPKEPVDIEAAKAAMDTIIAEGAFSAMSGKPAVKKEVRLVERTVDTYSIQ